MYSIYKSAYLTLAASKTEDSSSGLYSEESWTFETQRIKSADGIDGLGTVYAWKALDHPLHASWEETREEFPLLQRAWVYQERLLSRQILHFMKDELVWEC
ncbi:hypothetical protein K469DRAFT_782404, partial [Zopfia rhizophila CBS 207.26]